MSRPVVMVRTNEHRPADRRAGSLPARKTADHGEGRGALRPLEAASARIRATISIAVAVPGQGRGAINRGDTGTSGR